VKVSKVSHISSVGNISHYDLLHAKQQNYLLSDLLDMIGF